MTERAVERDGVRVISAFEGTELAIVSDERAESADIPETALPLPG